MPKKRVIKVSLPRKTDKVAIRSSSEEDEGQGNLFIDLDQANLEEATKSPERFDWEDSDDDDPEPPSNIVEQLGFFTVEAEANSKEDKDKDYFEVEKIVDHKYSASGSNSDGLQLKIDWKGYPGQESWIPLENCDGCVKLVNAYFRKNKLGKANLMQRAGATNLAKCNPDIWVPIKKVLLAIESRRSTMKTLAPIQVNFYEKFGNEDGIYILYHRCHLFVVLFIAGSRKCFLADGGNLYLSKPEYQSEIQSILKTRIEPMIFRYQRCVDHCGSSAVVLAIEMIRIYNKKELFDKVGWPKEIVCPSKFHEAIIKSFYVQESELEPDREANIKNRAWPKCPICGKTWQSNAKQKLSAHLKHCKPED